MGAKQLNYALSRQLQFSNKGIFWAVRKRSQEVKSQVFYDSFMLRGGFSLMLRNVKSSVGFFFFL